MKNFKAHSDRCFRDQLPPCTCACPLGLDVRGIIEKIQRGNFTSAYRVYRNQALFPGVVSKICHEPCRTVCVRTKHDEAVSLKKLEAACVAFSKDKEPIQYNVPAKPFTIAVIGAGLSGLSCALKLAGRNYTVRLYDQSERIGGRLWDMLRSEDFLEEIEQQLASVEYERLLSVRVEDIDGIEADAVYIATGSGGNDFGLRESMDVMSLGTARPGVFMGGSILGASPVGAIEHGVRASHSIEKFLKVGAMDGVPETFAWPVLNERFYSLPVEKTFAAVNDAESLSVEEAVAEGRRCLRCNCSLCRDNCEMMQQFNAFPVKITADIMSSLNVIEGLTTRVAQRLVNSCTQCGLCGQVCPESINMESCILEARRCLHKDGSLPPAFHDFWVRDMEYANSEAYLLHLPEGNDKSSYMFFPGCQLGASDPEYVLKTYEHLCGVCADTALLLACCGVPADWAGDVPLRDSVLQKLRADWELVGRPKLIIACPTCLKTLGRYLPESEHISLYEFLARHWSESTGIHDAGVVSIYDPCSSRDDPSMQQSVRDLARKAGLRFEELESSLQDARCCSFGGHIYAANPALSKEIVARRVEASANEYITYCTNCRDIFAAAGKQNRHILDVLFTNNPADRKPPSLTQRRVNRLLLKRRFMDTAGAEMLNGQGDVIPMTLVISPELAQKMDKLLILEEDIRQTIRHCEDNNEKVFDQATGQYSGYLQIGVITCWVTYGKNGGSFVLNNVYAHRMVIEG